MEGKVYCIYSGLCRGKAARLGARHFILLALIFPINDRMKNMFMDIACERARMCFKFVVNLGISAFIKDTLRFS